jgi:hypothetical protein
MTKRRPSMRTFKRLILGAVYYVSPRWAQWLANATEASWEYECPNCGWRISHVAHVGGESAWERPGDTWTEDTTPKTYFVLDLGERPA